MRALASPLLCLAVATRVVASDDGAWSAVPAVPGAPVGVALTVEQPPSEDDVRLVGAEPSKETPQTAVSRQVLTWAITDSSKGALASAPEVADPPIPAEARWPNVHGVIDAGERSVVNRDGGAGVRNPWEVRIHPKIPDQVTVFTCSGIIAGGREGAVAIMNGRVVMRGAVLGDFSVARVQPNEVLLERNGDIFVIPRGRRVTVTMEVP
jgi:hypothetical protein